MAKEKIYQSGDIVEIYKELYIVHSHTDKKELLGRNRDGELRMVKIEHITKHWSLVEQ